jgi:hypothetical protein
VSEFGTQCDVFVKKTRSRVGYLRRRDRAAATIERLTGSFDSLGVGGAAAAGTEKDFRPRGYRCRPAGS